MTFGWRDIYEAALVRVTKRAPYFTEATLSLRGPIERRGIGTMTVDAHGRLFVDPDAIMRWGSVQTSGELFHLVSHVMLDHSGRCGERDPVKFNLAGCFEINPSLVDGHWPIESLILPSDVGLPDNLAAEDYYDRIPDMPLALSVTTAPSKGGPCGGAAGNPQPWEEPGENESLPEPMPREERHVIQRRTALAIQAHAHAEGRGMGSGRLLEWADAALKPTPVDWRRRLRSVVRNIIAQRSGIEQRTWARLSRRYWALRAVLGDIVPPSPSYYSPVGLIAVVADMSGSMKAATALDRPRYEAALAQTVMIARAIGVPVVGFGVDAEVREMARVRSHAQAAKLAKGFGGTDMRVGIKAALEVRPDVIVVITDGETPWPEAHELPRRTRIVPCIVGQREVPAHLGPVVRVE